MRAFILLCCVAAACAEQQGYNYQSGSHSNDGHLLTSGTGGGASRIGLSQVGGGLLSQPQSLFGQIEQAPLTAEYQKEYYTYSAPEEDSDDAAANQQISHTLKKSLRVVFIRTPENKGFENAALTLAKQSSEGKTAIYVLSKQTDIGSLAKQLQGLRSQSTNTPEVHFVKYRTPADAINAQKAIQGQYNALPGASHNTEGGTAPVLNFASRAPAQPGVSRPSQPVAAYLPGNPVPQQNYLPASLRRYRL